jgi:hypothetical protein
MDGCRSDLAVVGEPGLGGGRKYDLVVVEEGLEDLVHGVAFGHGK